MCGNPQKDQGDFTMSHTDSTKVLTTSLESENNEVYDHTFLSSPTQRPSLQTSSLALGLRHLLLASRKCMEDQRVKNGR